MKKAKLHSLITFFLLSAMQVHAKTPDEIIEGKKRAVFLITLHEKNDKKSLYVGGGFFTDNKGHFVTNKHVIEEYLLSPKNFLVQIQDNKGEEFTDIEIEKCSNQNKIDLCYGKITTDKKIYFFDVLNKSPNKTEGIAIIGHNGDYFSVKKGEVVNVEVNAADKWGVPLAEQENRDTSMVLLGKYEYKSGFCKGDSGSPVFDYLTGDLVGIFTICLGKKGGEKNKYAIDTKEIYSFINSDSKFTKIKIPAEHIYTTPKPAKVESAPEKGDEFEYERKTGKLE